MSLPWYLAALGAAVLWGIHYPLVDNALRKVSLPAVLLLTALPILLLLPLFHRTLAEDYRALAAMSWGERTAVLGLSLTSLAATVLLFLSIGGKNATLASLIEISYPLFVVLFAYLLFREVQLTVGVAAGALLVFAGIALIILQSR